MPAPKKKYIDPSNPPVHLLYNGHRVMPRPALQGLIRALLSEWKVDDDEKARLEKSVLGIAETLSDQRLVKRCEDDVSPNKKASVDQAAEYVTKNIASISRPCPTWLLRIQAQAIDQLLKESVYSKLKNARNSAHVVQLLRDHLPPIQQRVFLSSSCHCRDGKLHPRSLPPDKTLSDWGRISQPSRLRNTIIAYYHGQASDYTKQVLAGRHN